MAAYVVRLYRAAKNAITNSSPVELAVREATRSGAEVDENRMQQIAEYTFDPSYRREVVGILWKRIKDLGTTQHVLNALQLIDYLIRHGAMPVIQELRVMAVELEDLREYVAPDENTEYGDAVRELASDIFNLIHDEHSIILERKLALESRMKFTFNPREAFAFRGGGTDSQTSSAGSLDSVLRFGLIRDGKLSARSESTLTLKSFDLTEAPVLEAKEVENDCTIPEGEGRDDNDRYRPVGKDSGAPAYENQCLGTSSPVAPKGFYSDEVVSSSQLTQKLLDYHRNKGNMSSGPTTDNEAAIQRAKSTVDSEHSDLESLSQVNGNGNALADSEAGLHFI